jgi:hypothetical protein
VKVQAYRFVILCLASVVLTAAMPGGAAAHRSAASSSAAPVFAVPSSGATYPASGPYLFQVQPVTGATGYLWSFLQSGAIVYQNLDMDGHLSPASYTVAVTSAAHKAILPGTLTVRVRALLSDGTWSASGMVKIAIQGKAPSTGVLYQADTSGGFDKWKGTPAWRYLEDGQLVNVGMGGSSDNITAPYTLKTQDYAIEAQIQLAGTCYDVFQYGLEARLTPDGNGYFAGVTCGNYYFSYLAEGPICCAARIVPPGRLTVGMLWHTFRMELRGNHIRFLIDNALALEATDNRYLSSGQVGLWSAGAQINVRSFKILAL